MQRLLLAATALAVASGAILAAGGPSSTAADAMTLWYTKPAEKWVEALPIGNGRLGAMVFGGVERERIQMNEDTIWDGYRRDPANPASLKALPDIRRLLFEGKNDEAMKLAGKTMMGIPQGVKSYQPLGDLILEMPGLKAGEGYRRELNLDTAVATTRFQADGVTYTREVFASTPDNVHRSPPGRRQAGEHHRAPETRTREGRHVHQRCGRPEPPDSARPHSLQGRQDRRAARHEVRGPTPGHSARRHGGRQGRPDWRRQGRFAGPAGCRRHGFPRRRPRGALPRDPAAAAKKPYDALRAAHVAEHQRLFRRVELDLGDGAEDVRRLPTDARLDRVKKGGEDPGLVALYFQFGRYLLESCSRPGGMPANLQGLWSDQMNAPWNADYHTNINIQMNYWPAEVCNLSECHMPLFDFMDTLVDPGSRTAKTMYGARGWVVHHLTDPFDFTAPADGVQGIWPMGGAWLAQHPYEHYLFTGDKEFLAKRGYPLMKGRRGSSSIISSRPPPGRPWPANSCRAHPIRPRTHSSRPMAARRCSPTPPRWTWRSATTC